MRSIYDGIHDGLTQDWPLRPTISHFRLFETTSQFRDGI